MLSFLFLKSTLKSIFASCNSLKDGKLRLIDFGSARIGPMPLRTAEERSVAEEDIAKNTTQMYRAPEMIDLYLRDILTEKTDIWALGCVFYALIFLTHPFQEAGNLGILGGVSNIPAASNVSADAVALIPRMLDVSYLTCILLSAFFYELEFIFVFIFCFKIDPEGRPSIPELLECARALLTGQPMPTLVVPEAVLQRRIERAENDKRRMQLLASKQKKNVAPAPRAPAPLDSNSVAARRLAAKRGQVVSGPPAPIQPSAIISPKSLTTKSFDEPKSEAFDSGGHATSGDFFGADFPSTGIISAAANDLFFDDSSAPETITKSAAPFNSPDEFEPSSRKGMIKLFGSAEAVDEPATQYSSSHNDGFDPFSDTAGAATFDPFEEHVSRDSFGGKAGKVDRFSSGFPADDLFNDNQSISGPSTSSVKRTSFGEAEQRHSFTVAASTNTNPWDSDPFTSSATPTKVTYPIVPDPFSTSSQPVPSHPQLSLGNEAFDPFADSAPVMSPTPYQPPANGSRSGSATFLDDFTNVSLTSNQKPKRNSNELLSLFDQQTHVPGPTTTQGYGRRGSGGENMIGGYGLPTSGMHHTSGPSFGAGQGFFNHPPAGYGHAPNNPFGPPPNDPFGNLGVFPKRG